MKQMILIFAAIISAQTVAAQSSKALVNRSLKGMKDPLIEISTTGPSLFVEGYNGNDLIIEPYHIKPLKDKTVEELGLKKIASLISLQQEKPPYIKEQPSYLQITIGPSNYEALLIKIPRNTHLKLSATGIKGRKLVVKNLTGEVDVRGSMPLIEIDNISSPFTVNTNATTTSKIIISNIKFNSKVDTKGKFLLYLSSFMSDFDISLPKDIKATVYAHIDNGDIYSDFDIKHVYPASNNLNYLQGEINGGGIPISIISPYANVAIRKQN